MADVIEVVFEAENQATPALNSLIKGLEAATSATKELTNHIKEIKRPINDATKAVKAHANAFKTLADSIKRIAFYRAIRTALKAVTQGTKEGINNLVLYSQALSNLDSAHANQTMSEFATTALYVKNSIGAAVMPILQMLVPVVNAIADAFIWAANAVNQFFHAIKGESVFTKAKRYAVDYAKGLNTASGAAKELKKQLFGFDELNVFNSPSSGGGGGGAPELDPSKMFEESPVMANFDMLGDTIQQKLAAITTIVSGATLAVGAMLALSGINVPLGIALIAAGSIGLAAGSINWNTGDKAVRGAVARITAVLGGALLALGAILAFSNANLFLGIGLMAAGATALASAATINWDWLGSTIDEKMGSIVSIVSGMTLALGAILVFVPSMQMLGLGLLAAGAIGLATGLNMNDSLREMLVDKFNAIRDKVSLVSLALGAILVFIPSMMPIGLGLIALGAAGLVSKLTMSDKLKNEISSRLKDIEMIVGLSMTGIGAALLFTMPAIGIPLLIGGLGLVGASLDWDALNNIIKEKWEAIKQTGRNIKNDILGFVNSVKNFFKSLFNFNAQMTLTPSMQWGDNTPKGGKFFAEGGQPQTGSLFWAGEAGAELVGQVGGKTTVTTHDQFSEGMSEIMDGTNSVIMQAANALIQAIQSKPVPSIRIGDRDIVSMYDRGKTLAGGALVE